jgi:OmpR-family two-component system manganese-sensing response regulator
MAKILIVDDDKTLSGLITIYLADGAHTVDVSHTGQDAIGFLTLQDYDLVILDWMLPDLTGVEVCQHYRARGGTSRVLMLTSRSSEADKATGLDAGADDYLVKPFGPIEFQARVRALLRRPGAMAGKLLKVRDLELDLQKQRVIKNGKHVELRPREYNVLEFLMRHPGQSFTAEILLDRIWSTDSTSSVDNVRMHIMSLRKKLNDTDENPLIVNMRGRGYRIADC